MLMFLKKLFDTPRLPAPSQLAEANSDPERRIPVREPVEWTLAESEEQYRVLFEMSPMPTWIFDLETLAFLAVNEAAVRHYGYSRKEFLAMTVNDIRPPEDVPAFFEMLEEWKQDPWDAKYSSRPLRHWKRDGTNVDVEVTWRPIIFRGRPAGLVMSRDVTERKRASEKLSELASIAEFAEYAIIGKALEETLSSWNPGAEKMYGYSAEEVMGRPISILAPPDRTDEMPSILKKIRQGESVAPLETKQLTKDGALIDVSVTVSPIKDSAGQVTGASVIARNITELKRAEEELRESEMRFRSVAQSANEGIISADSAGQIISWNKGAEIIFGYSEEEALGRKLEILMPERFRPAHTKALQALHEGAEPRLSGRTIELAGLKKSGSEFPMELSLGYWKKGEEVFFTGIVRDITDRKRADLQIRKLNVELERRVEERTAELKRSNEELQQFAYVASHDLQEPLRMVSCFTQLLARRYKGRLDADAEEFIAYAVDGAARMHDLLNDLLLYSRVDTRGRPFEAVDCESALNAALDNLRVAVRESGAVVTHGPLPVAMADPPQIVQLFQNLVGNAIKFRRKDARPEVRVEAQLRDGEWRFSVADNGIGFEPRHADRIFVIFQRLHGHGEYPGTGIGLAVCKKIIERHGGKIWAESMPGGGAAFYFTLPREERNAA